MLVEGSLVRLEAGEDDGDGCDEKDSVCAGAGAGAGGCPIVHAIKYSEHMNSHCDLLPDIMCAQSVN